MADKKESKSDADGGEAPAKKSGGMKLIIIVALLLGVEGGLLYFFFARGAPKQVEAAEPVVVANPEDEKLVELLVLDDRLVNDRTGISYLYETEIYVKVRKKDESWVKDEIERSKNEIRAKVGGIWRTAEPTHFQEPLFETLTRRVEASRWSTAACSSSAPGSASTADPSEHRHERRPPQERSCGGVRLTEAASGHAQELRMKGRSCGDDSLQAQGLRGRSTVVVHSREAGCLSARRSGTAGGACQEP
jgi:flagellar basal body-associated protein FliL